MTTKDRLLSQLMFESQQGNQLSYETLLSEACVFLQSYLNQKINSSDQRDDIIQEVLLAVHKARHTYDCSKSFFGWMLAITHYKVNDHLRIQYKQNYQELDEQMTDNSLDKILENERRQQLINALDSLRPRPKEVLSLLKLEGYKISEVAIKLNLSESNVKVIAHRAYQSLESKLKDKL